MPKNDKALNALNPWTLCKWAVRQLNLNNFVKIKSLNLYEIRKEKIVKKANEHM
jgi:hypothetical protein